MMREGARPRAGRFLDGQRLFPIPENRIQKIDPNAGRALAATPAPATRGWRE